MTKQEAYQMGENAGHAAWTNCEPEPGEDRESAAFDAEENAHQYWTHDPFRSEDEFEEEALFDAYRQGVADMIHAMAKTQ